MKILHTSDWHVGRTIRGRSRADEHRAVLGEIAAIAGGEDVDLVLVAGDVFDSAAPTPEAERIVYQGLLDLARHAPVVVVSGNHDNPRRLEAVAPLLHLGRVRVASAVAPPGRGGVLRFPELGVRIALLPWLSRRGIVTASDLMEKDADDHAADFAGRVTRVIAALCEDLRTDEVNLVVGHMTVAGAATTGSERAVHTVIDYAVPSLAFPGELSYVALGHYHRQQRVPSPTEVWYSGSPLQLDFGEVEDRKGVLIMEAEPGLPARVTPIPLREGRPLLRLRGTLEQVVEAASDLPEAHVRVELDEPGRLGLADEVRERIPGVVDVVLARSAPVSAARESPERLGRAPAELFAEYLEAKRASDPALLRLFQDVMDEASSQEVG